MQMKLVISFYKLKHVPNNYVNRNRYPEAKYIAQFAEYYRLIVGSKTLGYQSKTLFRRIPQLRFVWPSIIM